MEITVRIEAPEICEAIKVLASAMAIGGAKLNANSALAQNHEAIVADLKKKAEIVTAMPEAPTSSVTAPTSVTAPEVTPEPVTPAPPPQPAVQAVPTAPPKTYTINDMHTAIQGLLDAGKRDDIKSIITGMGFGSLADIPADRHDELVNALRGLGAKI